MNNPELIRIEPEKMTVDRIRQIMYYPSNEEKPRLLVGLLKHMDPRRSMVFVNTRRAAEDVERILRGNGINAEAISGDVPQRKRLRMLRDFHEGTLAVLIGTDVASRGLHIPDVSHVFNYDLPQDPEDYVHRIGRTARAGADGDAISFGCEEYAISVPDIEAYIQRRLPVAPIPQEMLTELAPPESRHKQRQRIHGDEPPPRQHGGKRPRHGGRDRHGGDRFRPRAPSEQNAGAPKERPVAATDGQDGNAAAPAKRRRRGGRGRRRSDAGAAPAPTTNE
jgi:ATP-dependent RNA helicase RhlB